MLREQLRGRVQEQVQEQELVLLVREQELVQELVQEQVRVQELVQELVQVREQVQELLPRA